MDAHQVNLWNFGSGSTTAEINLGRRRSFLAWGSVTFTDPLTDYDRDNGVAMEVFQIDGSTLGSVGSGGAHLGSSGSTSNLRPGAFRGSGQRITFRLRTFHVSDLENYAVGCVLVFD
ncbi:hypothetical protein ESZ53_07600 [Salinibacterium sp. UTAS2018]|uniref:hypothetical protein n=1 Tax=unclassified Salinibacterium TaxID=2632331 RepID=UPI0010093F60|nr:MULTISPECIES: hypothetical protein [unclassified Salinibacterium]MBH0008370.1 hypothetical protein [Salinibacterium sp. SWN1162]QAV70318.1 hypothetical protein ESZ53_07600 [Salinibacterium sp. UTAS2018]